MASILRAQLISFDSAAWTAVVLLDGSVAEVVMPVGQWVPSGLLAADDVVAVLLFDDTNPDDGVVLGPFGGVAGSYNLPPIVNQPPTDGEVPIGRSSDGALVLNSITGTANQITVTGGAGTITLSTPQNTHTGASPTFAGLTVTGDATLSNLAFPIAAGDFTPIFLGSGTAGVFTYTVQFGKYLRLGPWVWVRGRVTISAIGTPPTGVISIANLPYTAASDSANNAALALGIISQINLSAGSLGLTCQVTAGTTTAPLIEYFDNAAAANLPAGALNTTASISFSGCYPV
jgi:hypothetical protein